MGERSGIRPRGAYSLADSIENGAGGVSGNHRNGDDAAAGGFYFFPANDLVAGPVAAFYQHVGQKFGDDFAGRGLMENDYGVDAFECGENLGAFVLGEYRAAGAFQLAYAGIAVQADDQGVTESAGLFEAANVARMKQIEAAVGEDDFAAVAFLAGKPHNRLL
jgi:hypothetical protein